MVHLGNDWDEILAGEFEQDGKHMIVGRGLGTHSINIRFCNRPQLLVVRLLPKPDEEEEVF